MRNIEVAHFFEEIADLLEILEDNPFKIRAYRKAAQNIRSLTEDIKNVAKEGGLEGLPGIGKDLAVKIEEILKTGKLAYHEKLKKKVPPVIVGLMSIPGLGPKTAKALHEKLKIKNIDDLEKMAKEHKISGLPGMKNKTEENILRGIELIKVKSQRMLLGTAINVANEVISRLKSLKEVKRISAAGSLRRMKEAVRDIDILVTSPNPKKVMNVFTALPMVKEVLAHGETKSSILTNDAIQVDVRVVAPGNFGAALVYFTGSKAHNIHMRNMAKKKGLKVNEYGVFSEKVEKWIAGKEEEDVYKALGLSHIPPEMREDRGELELAAKEAIPRLVDIEDIKGDLHVHSEWSDGAHTIEEIVEECRSRGYQYVAITDHSKSLKIAGGLSEKELMKQVEKIKKLNSESKGFKILAGIEVDILADGKLDYRDEILKDLDIVMAAIHSGFKQSKEILTKRISKAMENRYVNIIAHPTGRRIGARSPYELDFNKIFKLARETGTALEINGFTERLDLDDVNARAANEHGALLAIGTDTHVLSQLSSMALGVAIARRAWLRKEDIINTLPYKDLLNRLAK